MKWQLHKMTPPLNPQHYGTTISTAAPGIDACSPGQGRGCGWTARAGAWELHSRKAREEGVPVWEARGGVSLLYLLLKQCLGHPTTGSSLASASVLLCYAASEGASPFPGYNGKPQG